jgi:glucokinase
MPRLRSVLAGDLGGTKCRFALVGEDFTVHRVRQVPTVRERGPFLEAFDHALSAIVDDLPPGLEAPTAVGIGTAGVIPRDGSSIVRAPNLPLDGFPLAQHVKQRFGIPATLINDGRASAFGEYVRGHAVGRDPLLCLFFGTGIGIGLIVDGQPYGGATNAAGVVVRAVPWGTSKPIAVGVRSPNAPPWKSSPLAAASRRARGRWAVWSPRPRARGLPPKPRVRSSTTRRVPRARWWPTPARC